MATKRMCKDLIEVMMPEIHQYLRVLRKVATILRDKSTMTVNSIGLEHVVLHKESSESIIDVDDVQVKLADEIMVVARHEGIASTDLASITMNLSFVYCTRALSSTTLSCSTLEEHWISTLIAKKNKTLIDRRKRDAVMMKIPRRDTASAPYR